MFYGAQIKPYVAQPGAAPQPRSVIGEISTSMTGNLVLRIGQENQTPGWHQTEHVVLTPEEAREFASEILNLVGV